MAFMAGRIVTYSFYVAAASVAERQFGHVFLQFWGLPWSIAIQVILLVAVAVLAMLPWRDNPKKRSAKRAVLGI